MKLGPQSAVWSEEGAYSKGSCKYKQYEIVLSSKDSLFIQFIQSRKSIKILLLTFKFPPQSYKENL